MSVTLDTPVMPDIPLSAVGKTLARFGEVKEWARRHQKEAIGKDVDPGYCWGDYLSCIKQARGPRDSRGARVRLENVYRSPFVTVEKTAMDVASGVIGGYLVPQAFSSALLQGVAEKSIFRRYGAMVVECDAGSNLLPVFDYGNVTNASLKVGQPPYWGGLWPQAYQASTTGRPESEPVFRQIELNPWVVTFNCYESNTIRLDMAASPGTEAMLVQGFVEATAWAEDYLFFQGTGVGQPLGIANAPGTLLVTRQTPGTITILDTQKITGSLLPLGADDAIWVIQAGSLAKLTAVTGWVPNTAGPLYLHGRPVVPSSGKPATLGTVGDLLYFSPALYAIGVRKNADLLLDFSDQVPTPFLANQSIWRMVHRVDGQPRLSSSVKLEDQATVVAGYVALN